MAYYKPIGLIKLWQLINTWHKLIDRFIDNLIRVIIQKFGIFSVKEAICGPVPMIVMPLFAEQAHNVRL